MYDEGEQGISGIKVVMTEVDKDGNKTQGGKHMKQQQMTKVTLK